MQRLAVVIPRTIEPGLIVEPLDINDQRVAFPFADRYPIQESTGASTGPLMLMTREALANSYAIRIAVGVCTI